MKTAEILVTVKSSERTRWLYPVEHFTDALGPVVESAVRASTDGPIPQVEIKLLKKERGHNPPLTAEQHNAFPKGRW